MYSVLNCMYKRKVLLLFLASIVLDCIGVPVAVGQSTVPDKEIRSYEVVNTLPNAKSLSQEDKKFLDFVDSIRTLRELDPVTFNNILSLSEDVSGTISESMPFESPIRKLYWGNYTDKRLMMLGLLSDLARSMTSAHNRDDFLQQICASFRRGGFGTQNRYCKEHLEILFYSVFEPELNVTPELTNGTVEVLRLLEETAQQGAPTCKPVATQLLVLAAYRIPSMRKRIFELDSVLDDSSDFDSFQSMYDRFWNYYGEPVPHKVYEEIKVESTEHLLDFVLNQMTTSNLWQIYFSVLVQRIDHGAKGRKIVSSLLSNEMFALRHGTSILPRPIFESAPEPEQHFMDFVINLLEDKLSGGMQWACEALYSVVRLPTDVRQGLDVDNPETEQVYGIEKVKHILEGALLSSDSEIRACATRCLSELR